MIRFAEAALLKNGYQEGNVEMAEKGERLLIVDDDRLVLATLVSGLKSAGFDVVEADNGDDAILLVRANPPHLALLDIRMQGKSGLDVARYLKANTDVPFMFLSDRKSTRLNSSH